MINCIIVDDEPLALEILKNYIEKIPFLNLIGEYTDAIKVLTDIGKYSVDLIFCDIEMPDINGIQFATRIFLFFHFAIEIIVIKMNGKSQ